MKNKITLNKPKITSLFGGILLILVGTSFKASGPETLTKRDDTVAYNRALYELEIHMRQDHILDANIEEYLKVFDKQYQMVPENELKKNDRITVEPKGKKGTKPTIKHENGWYFMFDK